MNCNLNNDNCDFVAVHEETVRPLREQMEDEETLYELAELFKLFGDSTRIKILWALDKADMCVCDISSLLNMTQSAISHQLRVLKQAKLVKSVREGKSIIYSLKDEHVRMIFDLALTHINE